MSDAGTFEAQLFEWDGPAAWTFVRVPPSCAPEINRPFGRVPVTALVDGNEWSTSVWHDKRAGWLLPVPKRMRPGKNDGDIVNVSLEVDHSRV
jgi:hypothetical protein